nr:immunoglobulin light chain junction region [Macaca mulatta]MPN89361.1 immunoglobulin light chain junction region [Macaca mulatta]
CRQCNTNPWTF